MLCPVCHGSGSLVTFAHGREYWTCPCCGGNGVRIVYGPPEIHIHKFKAKKPKVKK